MFRLFIYGGDTQDFETLDSVLTEARKLLDPANPQASSVTIEPIEIPDYAWPDPHGNGWIDAWNGWYSTLDEAITDGANGVGRPWVLARGEGIITEEEMERRLA